MNPDHTHPSAVLHVSDHPEDIHRALGTAALLAEQWEHLNVRIIVNGPALAGTTETANTLVMPSGVSVEACLTGLGRQSITPEQLQPGISAVGSAAVALIDAQLNGAAYIRI